MRPKTKITNIFAKKDINIGIVVFLFVLIYLGIYIYVFFTKSEVALYEVRPGTLFSDQKYTGIILRTEEIVYTDNAGYVNYYFREGDRVSKNEMIYSIDSDKSIYDRLMGDGNEIMLENNDISELKQRIHKEYREADTFREYKNLKEELSIAYTKQLDKRLIKKLNDIVKDTGITDNFNIVKSEKAGILSFTFDDYSNISFEDITESTFEAAKEGTHINTSDLVAKDAPVYKIITADNWQIVVDIDEELFKKLRDNNTVTFIINKKQTITAPVETVTRKNKYYAVISLSKYITNYTEDRFVDISFDTVVTEGLKLPLTAIANRNYYRIPSEYFVYDEKTEEYSLMVEYYDKDSGERAYKPVITEIFYDDKIYKYVDTDILPPETYIKTDDSRNLLTTYTVMLEGAYNINNGYAVFKRIERLTTEGEYTLVKKNSVSGLSEFDHIALDSSNVNQGEVIY